MRVGSPWRTTEPSTDTMDIARLAQVAVKLIKKVIRAEAEAQALRHGIEHLGTLAQSVGKVLRHRREQRGKVEPPSAEKDVLKTTKESLVECRTCLKLLCDQLKPYDDGRGRGTLEKMSAGFKFVNSEPFIRSQLSIINTHLQNLTLSVTLLNSLDHIDSTRQLQEQNRYIREVRTLLQAVVRRAGDEQSSLAELYEVDIAEVRDSDQALEDQISEDDTAGEENDAEIDVTRRCEECWKRNLPVPDSPLAIAVKHKEADIVRGILESPEVVDIRIRDAEDWTLLHYAAHNADLETLSALLESSVGRAPEFVNATSKEGQTALMQVAKQADTDQSLELAKVLIDHGCDLDIEDDSDIGNSSEEGSAIGRSALYFIIDGPKTPNRERLVELFVGKGANKTIIQETYPEKAAYYPALREESQKRDRGSSTSSITGRVMRTLSRSDS